MHAGKNMGIMTTLEKNLLQKGMAPGVLSPLAIPPQVGTTQEVFGRPSARLPHPSPWCQRGATHAPLAIWVLAGPSAGRIQTRTWQLPLPTTGCSGPPRPRRTPLCP